MGRRIRWLGVVLILCFSLVMFQLVNVQFRQANALNDQAHNPRVIALKYTQTRGDVLAADGTILAQSTKTNNGLYKYQRSYPTKELFAQIVGYDSYIYGLSEGGAAVRPVPHAAQGVGQDHRPALEPAIGRRRRHADRVAVTAAARAAAAGGA
jgi:peptidoglycan glycosyltransferase